MKSTNTTIATLMIASAALLGGCASTSSDPYNTGTYPAYGQPGYSSTAAMGYGTIDSIQVTRGQARHQRHRRRGRRPGRRTGR